MLRKPPGVVFIGAVVAVCAYAVASTWIIGATSEEYGLYVFVTLLVAVPPTVMRTILALRAPRESPAPPATVVRIGIGPALLAFGFLALVSSGPQNLRLAYSRESLDDYARTVTAGECDSSSFRPRRVGLYTVICASRPDGSHVSLEVSDRLTPDDTGRWYLLGPGHWEFVLHD